MNIKYLSLLLIVIIGTTFADAAWPQKAWRSLDEDTRYVMVPSAALFTLGCAMHYRAGSKATQLAGGVLEAVGLSGLAAISLWQIMNNR